MIIKIPKMTEISTFHLYANRPGGSGWAEDSPYAIMKTPSLNFQDLRGACFG
jgi:hypothetical protein